MPRVSVVLPFRNAERYLSEALESILAQEFTDFELIAVDDGSEDRSMAIVESAAGRDSRIRLVKTGGQGLPAALNLGIAVAEGAYVARMDADDVAMPARFSFQVAALDRDRRLVVIGSAVDQIDSTGRLLETAWYPTDSSIVGALLARGGCCLCHPATMIRRDALVAVGGYRTSVPLTEDYDLWLRLMRVGDIRNLDSRLLQYRLHAYSVAFRHTREQITSYLRSAVLNNDDLSESERTQIERSTDLNALIRQVDPNGDPADVFLDFVEWYVERAVLVSSIRTVKRLAENLADLAPGGRSGWVERCLRETAALTAASLGRHAAAYRLLIGRGYNRSGGRAIWGAVRRPPSISLSREVPTPSGDAAGYLDRLSVHEAGTQLMLQGWLPISGGMLPPELRIVLPAGGSVSSLRIKRRADVSRVLGPDHLHSGFRVLVRLDAPLIPRDSLPTIWTRSRQGVWRPLYQDQTIVDWGDWDI